MDTTVNPTNGCASPWTDDLIEALKQDWIDGLSCSQIGEKHGITRNQVIGKVHRLGLESRKRQPATVLSRAERAAKRVAVNRARSFAQRQKSRIPLEPSIIEEGPKPPEFLGIALLDLMDGDCRFPRGEGADIRFCGQPRLAGASYCPHCYSIVYRVAA